MHLSMISERHELHILVDVLHAMVPEQHYLALCDLLGPG